MCIDILNLKLTKIVEIIKLGCWDLKNSDKDTYIQLLSYE